MAIDRKTETDLKRRWCRLVVRYERLLERMCKAEEKPGGRAEVKALRKQMAAVDTSKIELAHAYQEAGGTLRTVVFFGEMAARGPDHSDVDDALRARFGREQVLPASESGGFYAYASSACADELERFLRATYPSLSFKREDLPAAELTIPGIVGLAGAREWLKKDLERRQLAKPNVRSTRPPVKKTARATSRRKTAGRSGARTR